MTSAQNIKGKSRKEGPQQAIKHLFTTNDVWGNVVYCTHQNWTAHIIVNHPELAGREADVIAAIQDPDRVTPSTKTGLAFGHEKEIRQETVRAITYYLNPAVLKDGTTEGRLGTAYLVDILTYRSQVGAPIYVKPVTPYRQVVETVKQGEEDEQP